MKVLLGILKAKIYNIPVVLGSATPSLESLNNVKQNKYKLLTLLKRASNLDLPRITIYDIKHTFNKSGKLIICLIEFRLLHEIEHVMAAILKSYKPNEIGVAIMYGNKNKSFEEKRYWRGPVWVNCNWIIYQGLKNKDNRFANQIKKKTIDLVKQKGFNEYFSCKTGKGFGATNFSWTASLFLDLILENKYE